MKTEDEDYFIGLTDLNKLKNILNSWSYSISHNSLEMDKHVTFEEYLRNQGSYGINVWTGLAIQCNFKNVRECLIAALQINSFAIYSSHPLYPHRGVELAKDLGL